MESILVHRPLHRRSEEHTSELQSHHDLVCSLLLEKKKEMQIKNWKAEKPAPDAKSRWIHGLSSSPQRDGAAMRKTDTAPMVFFFNDTATTEIYTLSLHDALPI